MSPRLRRAALAAIVPVAVAGAAQAGPELVTLPPDYETSMPVVVTVDKPLAGEVRVLRLNREAIAAAAAGQPFPHGTTIVMADHIAERTPDGRNKLDEQGRMVPGPEKIVVLVQQKGQGWGADYPEAWRNGEWEYALFNAKGYPLDVKSFQGCFACHKSQSGEDFTFLTWSSIQSRLKR